MCVCVCVVCIVYVCVFSTVQITRTMFWEGLPFRNGYIHADIHTHLVICNHPSF